MLKTPLISALSPYISKTAQWIFFLLQNFFNFAKSYILSYLSKFYNKKKIQRAVFEVEVLKAEIKGVFSRL